MIRKHLLLFFVLLSFSAIKAQFSGNALDFDGSNDQVDIATVPSVFANPATSDFTIEAWVNPRGSVFARIFFAQSSTSNFVSLGTNTGNTIYFYVIKNGTTVSVATSSSIPQNQWTHVTARWTSASSSAQVFFNGVLQSGGSGGSSSTGTSGLVTIGARTGGSQYFNGQIDELRVWDYARTACEIQANMSNTIPSAQTNLIMSYDFNQGIAAGANATVTALPDLSGSAYTGTLTNFALTGSTSNWVASGATVTATGPSTVVISAITSQTNVSCNGANNGIASVTAGGTGPFTYTWMPGGATTSSLASLAAGNYTVSVSNTCGTISRTLTVSEPSALSLSTTATSASVCAGNSTTLTAVGSGGTGAITYTWTGNSPSATTVVSPAATTVYTVNGSDANGCITTTTLNITVNALPVVSLSVAASAICINSGSVTLTGAPSGGTYSGANVSGTAFTPVATGTFTPVYSFTNTTTGCVNTATTAIVVSQCTGIESSDNKDAIINIYPNPASGIVTIELSVPAQISITNMVGSKIPVTEATLIAGKHSFDLSNEAGGVYFVCVQEKGRNYVIKLVKQ